MRLEGEDKADNGGKKALGFFMREQGLWVRK